MAQDCHVEPIQKSKASVNLLQHTDCATLAIWGMGCQNCVTRVRNSLLSLTGVYDVDIFLNIALAEVIYDRTILLPVELVSAVARASSDNNHVYRAQLIVAE